MSHDRTHTRALAQETVEILTAGSYLHPEAGRISIKEPLDKARAGTVLDWSAEHRFIGPFERTFAPQ